jgi:hypothetical protein
MLYLALSSCFTLRDYLAFTALLGVLLAVGGYGRTASASSARWLQAGGQARLLTANGSQNRLRQPPPRYAR